MSERSTRKVMVVNDDQALRASLASSLSANEYYEVSTATDGYDALWQLKHGLVDLVISDLEMPGMPGREFLSIVRRRFLEILVIALDETDDGEVEPSIVEADALCPRDQQHPRRLLWTVAELLRTSAMRRRSHLMETAVVCVVSDRNDGPGMPNILLNCTGCLQSFSIVAPKESTTIEVLEVGCFFCGNKLRYIMGSPQFIASSCEIQGKKRRHHLGLHPLYDSATTLIVLAQQRLRSFWLQLAKGRRACEPPEPQSRPNGIDRADEKGVEVGDTPHSHNLRGTR